MISPCFPTAHSMNNPPRTAPPGSSEAEASFGSDGSSCCSRASEWCVTLRPFTVAGWISMARTQRGSVTPVGTTGLYHASSATAGTVQSGDLMTRSGGPPNTSAKFHFDSSGQDRKSTRLNSSHGYISYAVFCLKKKKKHIKRNEKHMNKYTLRLT